jgi:multiple sugar transport system permease protein
MTEPRVTGMRVSTALCLAWGAAAALAAMRAMAHTEYALAAVEARAVAASMDSTWSPRRTPIRSAPAAGRIVPVIRTMERHLGDEARRIGRDDRALVLSGGFLRYVSVPIKDADAWDITGAVVLRAEWTRGSRWVWLTIALTVLLGSVLAARGVRHASTSRGAPPYFLVADGVLALALGTAALIVLLRAHIEGAAALLPPVTAVTRFDPLALPLPDGRLVTVQLVGLLLAVVSLLMLTAWAVSPQHPASERRSAVAAWGFLAPSAVHLVVFTAGPLLFTAYLSLHDWDLLAPARPFVGLGNYRELFADPLFWNALGNTALYSLYVPVTMLLALGAALLLDQPLRGVRVLRAIVFLPTIVSYVAIAMVWQWIYHADYGLLNYVVTAFGGAGIDWLGNPRTALVAVMIVSAWVQLGYQMIVYLAGLQGIPAPLHESARLDGAGWWARLRHITWPLLRPVSLYLFITGMIWSFQVFTLVYVMTEGGPVRSTDVLVYQIYQNAFEFRRMGYASAISWVLFAILVVLTAVQWRLLNRRVEHAA